MKLELKDPFFFSVDFELETASVIPFVVRARPSVLKLAPIHGGGGGLGQRSNESNGVRLFYIVDDLRVKCVIPQYRQNRDNILLNVLFECLWRGIFDSEDLAEFLRVRLTYHLRCELSSFFLVAFCGQVRLAVNGCEIISGALACSVNTRGKQLVGGKSRQTRNQQVDFVLAVFERSIIWNAETVTNRLFENLAGVFGFQGRGCGLGHCKNCI